MFLIMKIDDKRGRKPYCSLTNKSDNLLQGFPSQYNMVEVDLWLL